MNNFGNISNKEVVYTNYPFCYSDLPTECTLVHYDNFLYQNWGIIQVLLVILLVKLIYLSIKKFLINKNTGKLIGKILLIIILILILYSILFSNMTASDMLVG